MLPPSSNNGAFIAKLGAWLQLAQFVSLFGTVNGMQKVFRVLAASGKSDAAQLSGAIGDVLAVAFTGISVSLGGILLILISLTICHYRARWLFWFLCIYGGLMIFSYFFPFGLFFLIYGLLKKDEFLRTAQIPPSVPQTRLHG